MLYEVRHETRFQYEWPVAISHQLLKLRPRRCTRQNVLETAVTLSPQPGFQRDWLDYFGNVVEFVTVQGSHSELVVTSTSQVEVIAASAVMLEMSPPWEDVVAQLGTHLQGEWLGANGFRFESPFIRFDPTIQAFAREIFTPGRPVLDGARALTAHIHRNFSYQGGVTDIYTPASEVLRDRRGVCQDFAHLAIAALRSLGLPARYVSGYLRTEASNGVPHIGADASHAWVQVWAPGTPGVPADGWLDLDPTNDLVPAADHVRLATGRDYGDVAPLRGVIRGGGRHELTVGVTTRPFHPLPAPGPGVANLMAGQVAR